MNSKFQGCRTETHLSFKYYWEREIRLKLKRAVFSEVPVIEGLAWVQWWNPGFPPKPPQYYMQILGVARVGHEINCSSRMSETYMQLGRMFSLPPGHRLLVSLKLKAYDPLLSDPQSCPTPGGTLWPNVQIAPRVVQNANPDSFIMESFIPPHVKMMFIPAGYSIPVFFPTAWFRFKEVFVSVCFFTFFCASF